MPGSDRLYFRQLLSGRDFAVGDPVATQMRNFAYLIGDRQTGDAVLLTAGTLELLTDHRVEFAERHRRIAQDQRRIAGLAPPGEMVQRLRTVG